MKKIKIAFFGTPVFAIPVLEGLIENYDVVLVVSQPDKAVGRSKELKSTPIKDLALSHNIKVITPVKIKDDYEEIFKTEIDLIVTCAYGQIIPKAILEYPRLGCINVHASLLPKLRGGAPIHRAVIEGHEKTGITIMEMAEKMDAGNIISQEELPIDIKDNTGIIHDKLRIMGKELLLKTLPSIIDQVNESVKQDENDVTYAPNLKREEELLTKENTTLDLYNKIRGLNPWPLAYIIIDGQEVKVLEASIEEQDIAGDIGSIIAIEDNKLIIKTIDGYLGIKKIKPASKKELTVKEYLNSRSKEELIGKRVM